MLFDLSIFDMDICIVFLIINFDAVVYQMILYSNHLWIAYKSFARLQHGSRKVLHMINHLLLTSPAPHPIISHQPNLLFDCCDAFRFAYHTPGAMGITGLPQPLMDAQVLN